MLNIQSLIKFPVPLSNSSICASIEDGVDEIIGNGNFEHQRRLDSTIFSLYGFNEEEIEEIRQL